jgi:hypothetical protein
VVADEWPRRESDPRESHLAERTWRADLAHLDRAVRRMDRRGELAVLDEVELVRLGALARYLGAGFHVDRLERACEAREAHAIEIAEVRNESEESLESVAVVGIARGD